jgi:hypothetical protein
MYILHFDIIFFHIYPSCISFISAIISILNVYPSLLIYSITNFLFIFFIVQESSFFQSARKSGLLSAAKKARLKSHPSRVRFAEGVVISGSSPPAVST